MYSIQRFAHDIGVRYRGAASKLFIGPSVFFNAEFHRIKTVTQNEALHGLGAAPRGVCQSVDSGLRDFRQLYF